LSVPGMWYRLGIAGTSATITRASTTATPRYEASRFV
jgi:hypothetical protein